MARKLLAARADLVEETSRIARSRGQTIYSLVNNILEQALRVQRMNIDMKDVVDSYMVIRSFKSLGFTALPNDLAYKALDAIFNNDSKNVEELALNLGKWYGRIFKAQFPGVKPLDMLRMVICELAWGASEFSVVRNDGDLMVRCIGPRFPESYTTILARMVEGLVSSIGFETVKRYVTRGVILLTLKRGA